MKKATWKTYLFWIAFSELVGLLSGWLIRDGIQAFNLTVAQPMLSPPAIVFPIVWTVLYALMGISATRIDLAPETDARSKGLTLFLIQLVFNSFWSLIFFNRQAYGFALLWLAALWILILWMILTFRKTDVPAAWLQLPYLIWVSFAAVLNFGVWRLN